MGNCASGRMKGDALVCGANADDTWRIDEIIRAGAEPEQIAPAEFIGNPLGKRSHSNGRAGADIDRPLFRAERTLCDHSPSLADI